MNLKEWKKDYEKKEDEKKKAETKIEYERNINLQAWQL